MNGLIRGGMRMLFVVGIVSVWAGAARGATEWHVYGEEKNGMTGNQQLTNAFVQAQAGDTITIHKGTYNLSTEELTFRFEKDTAGTLHETAGICLYSTVDNLTVRGDPETPHGEIVLSGMGANTSGDGQHAVMRLTGQDCTVSNLTFYRGYCLFKGEVYLNGRHVGDDWVYRRGGGLYMGSGGKCFDCTFDGCYAGHGASIYNGEEVRRCTFMNSSAVANNAGSSVCEVKNIYDSEFTGNKRGAVRGCSGTVSNCVFSGNWHTGGTGLFCYQTGSVIDCAFSNNTTVCLYLHGAKYMPKEIRGCTFAYNSDSTYPHSAGVGGSVACTVPLTECTFIGPNQVNGFSQKISKCTFVREKLSSVSVLADCPQVYDCTFYGTSPNNAKILEASTDSYVSVITNCSLYRCEIYNFNIRYGNVLTDVDRMENCLVRGTVLWGRAGDDPSGCDVSGTFRFTDGDDVEILNCTFTTNQSNGAYVNTGGGTVTFKNTLFFNNLTGSVRTWGYYDFAGTDETIRMVNSVYKCPTDLAGSSSFNWFETANTPKFLKETTSGTVCEHPYALRPVSACVDAGDTGTWTADDLDLAGNSRVNGVVDIGCYENWDAIPCFTVILR